MNLHLTLHPIKLGDLRARAYQILYHGLFHSRTKSEWPTAAAAQETEAGGHAGAEVQLYLNDCHLLVLGCLLDVNYDFLFLSS